MTLVHLAQVWLAAFGLTAIYLLGCPGRCRRWGFVCGLAAQPAWLYATLTAQYGITLLCFAYTAVYLRGLRNAWRTEG